MTQIITDSDLSTVSIDTQIESLREEMAALNKRRIATLPRLSADERNFLTDIEVDVARSEAAAKKAAELRKNRQLTEEDRDQIAAARLDHRANINSPEGKAKALEAVKTAYLHSFKLTHRKDGRVGVAIRGAI